MIDFLISPRGSVESQGFKNSTDIGISFRLQTNSISFNKTVGSRTLMIIGDCLNPASFFTESMCFAKALETLKGNYYAILVDGDSIYVGTSGFGLLSLYYDKSRTFVSSSAQYIYNADNSSYHELDLEWMASQLMFNYQISNNTRFKDIKLFPAFSYLDLKEEASEFHEFYSLRKHLKRIRRKSSKLTLPSLVKLFMNNADQYIPNKGSVISFTSGFDGRTLVAAGLKLKKEFTTYSYGKRENDDIHIPKANAKKLGIKYFWTNLDLNYSKQNYENTAKHYIEKNSGANGFLYAHVNYAVKDILEVGDVLVSGICGSELFRAAHSPGAVASEALINLFLLDSQEEYTKKCFSSDVFCYYNMSEFKSAIEEVCAKAWHKREELLAYFDKNTALYTLVYEEVFRKFFGPWIKIQMDTITVRTPYADLGFFKELLSSELSGVHSDFLTHNPLKRFKGQMFYSEFIRQTNKKLFWMKTGKGYPPAFVNYSIFRPLLLLPYFRKRIFRKVVPTNYDNLGIISGMRALDVESLRPNDFSLDKLVNLDKLKTDVSRISNNANEAYRDGLLMSLSLLHYINITSK